MDKRKEFADDLKRLMHKYHPVDDGPHIVTSLGAMIAATIITHICLAYGRPFEKAQEGLELVKKDLDKQLLMAYEALLETGKTEVKH